VPGYPGAPDWQQGIGLAWRDGDEVHLEAREIRSGALVYDGVTLRGADQVEAIAEATGYRAMRPR